jgi:hypothetical protein
MDKWFPHQLQKKIWKFKNQFSFQDLKSDIKDCSICQSFTDTDDLKQIPCKHTFHAACVWVLVEIEWDLILQVFF